MIDLLYIASPSFSGSTLLTLLLNGHPRIATVGELKWGRIDLESYRCSCGAKLVTCGFWKYIQRSVEAAGLDFDLRRPATDFRFINDQLSDRVARARVRGPLFESVRAAALAALPQPRQRWRTIAAVNREVIRAALERTGANIFLDASKDPVRLKHLAETGDYRLQVLQLVRDGRAVAASARKNEGARIRDAAREWRRTHEQIQRLVNRLTDASFFTLRYEDLCQDASTVLSRLCTWLHVPSPITLEAARKAEHHILGNRMRLKPLGEIRLNDDWRETWSESDTREFDSVAAAQNRAFGYS